jgi:hypothetical protein
LVGLVKSSGWIEKFLLIGGNIWELALDLSLHGLNGFSGASMQIDGSATQVCSPWKAGRVDKLDENLHSSIDMKPLMRCSRMRCSQTLTHRRNARSKAQRAGAMPLPGPQAPSPLSAPPLPHFDLINRLHMPVPMMMLFVVIINKVTAGAILVGSSGPERGARCWPWLE